MVKSCYIHIPFCDRICSYCDFCKVLNNSKWVNNYLKDLEKEIDLKYNGEVFDTIYIGGGTPSSLSINELKELFRILDKLKKHSNTEYTIENNFESITLDKLDLYKEHGINRLSFGIETTHKKYLGFLNRDLDKEKVLDIIKIAKEKGFNNINVDLIYAIPNETINELIEDLNFILSLNIEHISTYSLIIEDNTLLKINNTKNISEDLDFKMYQEICKRLKNNGFIHYEISNFSKEGFESRHNLCYWNNLEYYGFGVGASSYINGIRRTNTRSITGYGKGKILEEEILNREDIIEYEIILNLRKSDGINLSEFKDKYHIDLKKLYNYEELINLKLLKLDNNHLFIPEDKLYISNSIIGRLLEKRNG